MIKLERHSEYDKWSVYSYGIDCHPCVICGKAIKKGNVKYRVFMHNGGEHLLSIEEANQHPEQYEELGMPPIGAECIRAHPELKSFIVRV